MKLYFIFALLFVMAACTLKVQPVPDPQDAISDEVIKLMGMADQGTITERDFATLDIMVHDNEKALDEIHEIKTFIKYKEYAHAVHGLGFLAEYLHTKKDIFCPGHALAHYYVYKKHGEEELAKEALEEAEKQFPDWKQKIMEDQKGHSMEEIIQAITAIDEHLKSIESGKNEITEAEIEYLSEDASICINGE